MSLTIIQEPNVTATTGDASYWLASENPMIFKFQRKDLIVQAVQDIGGGETRLTFTSTPYHINVGDSIWWGDISNTNDGEYLVTNVVGASNYIDIGVTITGHNLGWVNDTTNFLNFHAYLEIYEWEGAGLQGDTIAFAKFYDDQKGVITCDLRKYLQTKLELNWPSFFGVATKEPNIDQDFSFTYRDGFVHPTVDPTLFTPVLFDTRYWAYKASKQLGDQYGQNMRKYMSYKKPDPDTLMEFNTVFDEPYYFDGYPFALSWIYSDKTIDTFLNRRMQKLDINNRAIGADIGTQIATSIAEHGCVVTERGGLGLTDETEKFEIWIEDSDLLISGGGSGAGEGSGPGGDEAGYIDSDYVDNMFGQ